MSQLPTFEDEATTSGDGEALFGKVTVVLEGCPLGAKCRLTTEDATLGVFDGTINGTANLTANNVKVKMSGFGCGTEGTWSADGGSGGEAYTVKSMNGATSGSIFVE